MQGSSGTFWESWSVCQTRSRVDCSNVLSKAADIAYNANLHRRVLLRRTLLIIGLLQILWPQQPECWDSEWNSLQHARNVAKLHEIRLLSKLACKIWASCLRRRHWLCAVPRKRPLCSLLHQSLFLKEVGLLSQQLRSVIQHQSSPAAMHYVLSCCACHLPLHDWDRSCIINGQT